MAFGIAPPTKPNIANIETITSIDEVETDSNDKFYVLGYLETNPNDGEASGYWAGEILVECYGD